MNDNKIWWKNFKRDYLKLCGKEWKVIPGSLRVIKNNRIRYLFYGRLSCCKNKAIRIIAKNKLQKYSKRYGLEINFENIGAGFLIIHPFNITVNAGAIIKGECTLFKGSTIGSIRSGKKKGTPTIEKNVVLCINSTVVGDVHIGEDVLIAPNSYVNFDVPDHSVVIGNPGQIHYKENAAKDYLSGV